jgi:hypothetical protein
VIGDRTQQGFLAWTVPVGDELERIRAKFAARVADQEAGHFDQPWLMLTEAGRLAAQAIRCVKKVSPVEPDPVLQQRTLELIADLVTGGLAEVGALGGSGSRGFVPWESSPDEKLSRIRSGYVNEYDKPEIWEWYCVLELTRRGELFARVIEAQTQPR